MDQKTIWNGPSGSAWVESAEVLDPLLRPIEDLLVASVSGGRVLDVGCGTGSTTRALHATGIDISERMIEAARAKGGATYILGDAQTYPFEPDSFDVVVSRFGVMFFEDPVAAFTNLRRAAKRLVVVTFRTAAENPFMTTAERAVAHLLPMPPRNPDGPGQFAFGDRAKVQKILEASGWSHIAIEPIDVRAVLPEKDLLRYVTKLGPVGRALDGADEATRAKVASALRTAFEPFVHGDEVRFVNACWKISCTC